MSSEKNAPPSAEGFLERGAHRVKWYRYGNKSGAPVLFLHGGPGSGFDPDYATLFDLDKVDLITFDQRGSGRSTPLGSMEQNTTADLLDDIDALRMTTGIEKWIVAGHSWGATLALLYAQKYPEAVKAVTICGLFLARREDSAWAFDGARQFFGDALEKLRLALGAKEYGAAMAKRALSLLRDGTPDEKLQTAYALSVYNAPFSRLVPKSYALADMTDIAAQRLAVLFGYDEKGFFIRENQICEEAAKLNDIPVTIVHGRLDMDCPVAQAFAFKAAYPKTDLIVVQGSHSLCEEPLRSTYRQALEKTLRDA